MVILSFYVHVSSSLLQFLDRNMQQTLHSATLKTFAWPCNVKPSGFQLFCSYNTLHGLTHKFVRLIFTGIVLIGK
jgi:hypothetical protein